MIQTKSQSARRFRQLPCAADAIYHACTTLFLLFCGIVVFLPLLFVVSASFSSPTAIGNGEVYLLPVDFSLKGYTAVVTSQRVWQGFGNSIIYTTLGTFINIVMTMLAAYPLSRQDLRARGFICLLYTSPSPRDS